MGIRSDVIEQRCPECGIEKSTDHFYRASTPSGRMRVCKACHIARVQRRQAERYAKDDEYRARKVAWVMRRQAQRYSEDSEYRDRKVARVVSRQAERYTEDTEYRGRKVAHVVRRQAQLYSEDSRYAISKSVSAAIRASLVRGKDGAHWETLVGYTVSALMAHLEVNFAPGMTWDNYGAWHIDHVIPRAAFDFRSPEDPAFRECWGLQNLQPLWAADNMAKSDLLDDGTRARNSRDRS